MTITARKKTPLSEQLAVQRITDHITRTVTEAVVNADDSVGWENMNVTGDDPATYSGGPNVWRRPWARIRDRADGRFYPYYERERDLERMRNKCRDLATFTSIAVGALQALQVYTIGGAWEFEAIQRDGAEAPTALIDEVQVIVDELLNRNAWVGDLDCEIHAASREDGESLVAMYGQPDGMVDLRRLDCDNLREPAKSGPLCDWLQADPDRSSWSFGVLTLYDERMQRVDHERHVGYHVIFDDDGAEWDYLPAWPCAIGDQDLDGKCLHQVKRNTPRQAKRGISDYWPVLTDLEREDKLTENTSVGAACLAAVPWIEEMAPGTTRDQAAAQSTKSLDAYSAALTSRRGGERTVNRLRPGTIPRVAAGRKYIAGPMGQVRSPLYIEVGQMLKRRIGIRWLMPEYMISGDASNANFSSTLVSESPFVKAREADQRFYASHWRTIILKALKIAHDCGRFRRWVSSWAHFLSLVDLRVQAPPVATRDRVELIQELQATFDRGLMDGAEWRQQLDMEPKEGLENVTGALAAAGGQAVNDPTAALLAAMEGSSIADARFILETYRATP